MPVSYNRAHEQLVDRVTKVHVCLRGQVTCLHCGGLWPCDTIQLVKALQSVMPKVFSVGERVAAYDYKGALLGRGRVTASQRDNGPYMKVRLDPPAGKEVVVPQAMAKRLVKK